MDKRLAEFSSSLELKMHVFILNKANLQNFKNWRTFLCFCSFKTYAFNSLPVHGFIWLLNCSEFRIEQMPSPINPRILDNYLLFRVIRCLTFVSYTQAIVFWSHWTSYVSNQGLEVIYTNEARRYRSRMKTRSTMHDLIISRRNEMDESKTKKRIILFVESVNQDFLLLKCSERI